MSKSANKITQQNPSSGKNKLGRSAKTGRFVDVDQRDASPSARMSIKKNSKLNSAALIRLADR